MSAGLEEREDNWKKLVESWQVPGLVLAAFEHQCGGITSTEPYQREDGWGLVVCAGCRFVLDARNPDEYAPLYAPSPP